MVDPVPFSLLMPLAPWEPASQLTETLSTLLEQTWPIHELVVSTDGPLPDELHSILQQCGLPYRLLQGPGGEGVGPVLARGLLACSHDLVVRADADDLNLPHRCEFQITTMLARPSLAALSAPILEFLHSASSPVSLRGVPQGLEEVRRFSRWRNPLNHPAAVIRRSRVLEVGNYRSVPSFEDYDLWLRLLAVGEDLDNGSEPLVLARVGSAHLSRRHGWNYAKQELNFLCLIARSGLLPAHQVMLLLLLRLPLRLLPDRVLAHAMALLRRLGPRVTAAARDGVPASGD